MINWSQSYSSPSHYFDFALAQRGTKQSVTDFANLKMNQRPNCSLCTSPPSHSAHETTVNNFGFSECTNIEIFPGKGGI